MKNYDGYDPKFIKNQPVSLPELNEGQKKDLARSEKGDETMHYVNFSLQLSSSRKFPFFTASNIDGKQFKKIARADNWRKDSRISGENQFGKELYGAIKSDFDRGHMTKREDVQWGSTISEARNAADSTFFYTNSVPQHASLNQQIWKTLEDYILHTEAKENELRINVFTGPVLSKKDPDFVTKVNGVTIKIPTLFWKIVYYTKADKKLYRAGFLMSQESLLWDNDIVESFRDYELEALDEEDQLFMKFEEAETYQVNINTIEKLSGLKFPKAAEKYTDDRSIKLILEEIDVEESYLESADAEAQIGFSISNIVI
jgi:endonuclease G, mitochondrial